MCVCARTHVLSHSVVADFFATSWTLACQGPLCMGFSKQAYWKVKVKAAQLCPTLCDPMDYTIHGILQARNTEVGSLLLLQGIFPTQGSNPGLLHGRQILYQLSHEEHWIRLLIPSPGDLPDPGIEPGSPTLQEDSLPSEPPPLTSLTLRSSTVWLQHELLALMAMFAHTLTFAACS